MRSADALPAVLCKHHHRRTALVEVRHGSTRRLVVLDGEDSIFQTSPYDFYGVTCTSRAATAVSSSRANTLTSLCPGRRKAIPIIMSESTPDFSRISAHTCTRDYQTCLIGPDLDCPLPPSWWRDRLRGIKHRVSKLNAPWIDWGAQAHRFEHRWAQLLALRTSQPDMDVVLLDTLWGWPRHRRHLHDRLGELSPKFDIRAAASLPRTPSLRNRRCHAATTYRQITLWRSSGDGVKGPKELLARSRVGVFATGFHYGCRSIVSFAWMQGLKVLSRSIPRSNPW